MIKQEGLLKKRFNTVLIRKKMLKRRFTLNFVIIIQSSLKTNFTKSKEKLLTLKIKNFKESLKILIIYFQNINFKTPKLSNNF